MNKFIALSLLVAVALLAPATKGCAFSDAQEVAQLTDKSSLFKDFCLSTRDYINEDLRAKGLSLVPTTILDLLNDTANKNKNTKARLDQIAQNPGGELKKLDNFVVEQQKSFAQKVQEHPFDPSKIFNQAKNAGDQARERLQNFIKNPAPYLKKVDGFVTEKQRSLGQRIQNNPIQPAAFFKGAFEGIQSVAKRIKDAPAFLARETCKTIEEYEREILRRFEEAKKELASKDSSVSGMKLTDVPCATVARIRTIRNSCDEMKEEDSGFFV